jgi:hypothetical protein
VFFVSHEGVCGNGDISPIVPHFNTRWTRVVSFTQFMLYSRRKRLRYISNWRLGVSQGRSGRFGAKGSIESYIDQTIVLVTMQTTLSGLREVEGDLNMYKI